MEARFGSEVASIVEVAIQEAVSVFRDVWAREAPNAAWEEAKLGEIREIEKCLVVRIHKAFTEFSSELCEENEALRAKVEQLEDVLQRKAGQLEQELEARVGQLGREMEQLEKELRSISEGGGVAQGAATHVPLQDGSLRGEGQPSARRLRCRAHETHLAAASSVKTREPGPSHPQCLWCVRG